MIAWRRLHHFWEGAIVPVERTAVDNDATDTGAVPTNEFGGRMHDDVRAMLKGPAQVGRGERIIDDEREFMLVRDVRDSLDVEDISLGIADGLPVEQFSFRRNGTAEVFWISRIDKM